MVNCTFYLPDKQYNRSNIKYQILYYYPFICDIYMSDKSIILTMEEADCNNLDKGVIEKIIKDNELRSRINNKVLTVLPNYFNEIDSAYIKAEIKEIIYYLKGKNRNEIINDIYKVDQGINMYMGSAYELFCLLDSKISAILMKFYDTKEYSVPSLINVSELQKSNYLGGSFHHVNYVSKLKNEFDNLKNFKKVRVEEHVDKAYLTNSRQVLNPAVCLHCYPLLETTELDKDKESVFTLIGRSYRDESGNLDNTFRLKEFTMRELVVIGTKGLVESNFSKALELMNIIGTELELSFRLVTANDIFFDDNIASKTAYQTAMSNKIELEVYDELTGRDIAVASTNKHGTHFTKGYEITTDNTLATSMCLAFGYDRIMRALIHKHCLT